MNFIGLLSKSGEVAFIHIYLLPIFGGEKIDFPEIACGL